MRQLQLELHGRNWLGDDIPPGFGRGYRRLLILLFPVNISYPFQRISKHKAWLLTPSERHLCYRVIDVCKDQSF